MSADFLKICGIAVICAMLLVLLKKSFGGMDMIVRIGGGIAVFSLVLSGLGEAVAAIREMTSILGSAGGLLGNSFSLMIKALGISLLAKLCADICRDCGESTLAGGIESAGRIAIIGLCIPVVSELIGLALKILEIGE